MSGSVEKGNAPRLHHARLANTSRARHKAGMKDGHTTKSRRSFGKKLWCVLIVVFLSAAGWQMWKLHLYNNAVREAKEAGFEWECVDTISFIRQDWRNALKKETWGVNRRFFNMGAVPDLGRYREMLHHLRPTALMAKGCKDENVDAIKGLTTLQGISLSGCPALRNVDALKSLTALQSLELSGCALQNVDALKSLTALQSLDLDGCTALQNVDSLKSLTALQWLDLSACAPLRNVDAIKGLTALQTLYLSGCTALQNVDAIKGLTALEWLHLDGCTALQNVDALKNLTALQRLDLDDCTALQDVDALKSLTALRVLYLDGCDKIPAAALRELRVALPKTDITFPDGTKKPPQ